MVGTNHHVVLTGIVHLAQRECGGGVGEVAIEEVAQVGGIGSAEGQQGVFVVQGLFGLQCRDGIQQLGVG